MDVLTGLDVSIFRALNHLCGSSPVLDRVVVHLEVLKGSLFMGIVGLLWYWPDKKMTRRREIILTIILAVAVSLVLNRIVSMLAPYRDRPTLQKPYRSDDLREAIMAAWTSRDA